MYIHVFTININTVMPHYNTPHYNAHMDPKFLLRVETGAGATNYAVITLTCFMKLMFSMHSCVLKHMR